MVICLTMLPPEPRIWYGMYLIIYGNTVRIIMIVAAHRIQFIKYNNSHINTN